MTFNATPHFMRSRDCFKLTALLFAALLPISMRARRFHGGHPLGERASE
jgi:hypothetical protein